MRLLSAVIFLEMCGTRKYLYLRPGPELALLSMLLSSSVRRADFPFLKLLLIACLFLRDIIIVFEDGTLVYFSAPGGGAQVLTMQIRSWAARVAQRV